MEDSKDFPCKYKKKFLEQRFKSTARSITSLTGHKVLIAWWTIQSGRVPCKTTHRGAFETTGATLIFPRRRRHGNYEAAAAEPDPKLDLNRLCATKILLDSACGGNSWEETESLWGGLCPRSNHSRKSFIKVIIPFLNELMYDQLLIYVALVLRNAIRRNLKQCSREDKKTAVSQ